MAGSIMKKILFYPLCFIMSSCFVDNNNSSSKTQSLSKICDELNKYYNNLSKDEQNSQKENLSKIYSILLALKKICNAEKDNLNFDKKNCNDGCCKEFIDLLKKEKDFDKDDFSKLQTAINNNDATKIFLELYRALYKDSEKKNVFTKKKNNNIERIFENTDVITIFEEDVKAFKSKKNKSGNDKIYLSDLVNYWFQKNDFALLKSRKYLVVELEKKGDISFENIDKAEIFEHSLQGGTVIKFVCGIFSNGQYVEKCNVLDKNFPKFLNSKKNQIENNKNSGVVCLYSLEKVSDVKLESLNEDE